MLLKLFGRDIFRHNSGETLILNARNELKEQKILPDFYISHQFDLISEVEPISYITYQGINEGTSTAINSAQVSVVKKPEEKKEERKHREMKPKTIFKLKLLNEEGFTINTDGEYVFQQLQTLKDKLSLIQSSKYDMGNGVQEIASMIIRMENRKKYSRFKGFYSQYAYTTSKKIAKVLKSHSYLNMDKVEQFLADMPTEATNAMMEYKSKTKELCKKLPIFYIIANKKDFQKTNKRKDPILLAQSPFGHFWQVIGAWDEEMVLLDEL